MSEKLWTAEPPTEGGWYWVSCYGSVEEDPVHFQRTLRDRSWMFWLDLSTKYHGGFRVYEPWPVKGYLRSIKPVQPPPAPTPEKTQNGRQ